VFLQGDVLTNRSGGGTGRFLKKAPQKLASWRSFWLQTVCADDMVIRVGRISCVCAADSGKFDPKDQKGWRRLIGTAETLFAHAVEDTVIPFFKRKVMPAYAWEDAVLFYFSIDTSSSRMKPRAEKRYASQMKSLS